MSTTTAIRELGSCLVCNEPIEANAEVEISDLHLDGTAGTASVKVVGFSVSHDCRTKATDEPTTAACDRDHADEWVEVDDVPDLPDGARIRREWVRGVFNGGRLLVHRDDLPDLDAARIERMARAILASNYPNLRWESMGEDTQEHYRKCARAALAAYREGE